MTSMHICRMYHAIWTCIACTAAQERTIRCHAEAMRESNMSQLISILIRFYIRTSLAYRQSR